MLGDAMVRYRYDRALTQMQFAEIVGFSHSTVSKIEKAPQGGHNVFIGDRRHYVSAAQDIQVTKGQKVERGQPISSGSIDPKQLLALKGIRAVQDYVSTEMQSVLQTAVPVKRRNVEVVVKAMTDMTRIDDPGTHPDWSVGDMRPTALVNSWNSKSGKKGQQKPIQHSPVVKGVDTLPLEMQEDWVARPNFQNLNRTIAQGAREGWKSEIHGFHPVPGAAYAAEFGKGKDKLGPEWKGQY